MSYEIKREIFAGSDATGSDGDTNRTITLSNSGVISTSLLVVVDNFTLVYSNDFTYSSGVVTFSNMLFDSSNIQITYYVESNVESLSGNYCTTKQVFEYLGWAEDAPEFSSSATSNVELVDDSGTLASGSIIFLDNNKVIANTVSLYHGASATSLTALTETTHYTIDLDKGEITINSDGATEISTDNVYAKYQWNKFVPDSVMEDFIIRNTALIDELTHRTWQPSQAVSNETHIGKGPFDRKYRVKNLPLLSVSTVEISTTPVGSTPSYTTLTADEDYVVDLKTGYITLLFSDITSDGLILDRYPNKGVPDRFRVSYAYGSSTVEAEIIRLCVLMSARDTVTSAVAKGLSEGVDGFTPRANDILDQQINQILNKKTLLLADGF